MTATSYNFFFVVFSIPHPLPTTEIRLREAFLVMTIAYASPGTGDNSHFVFEFHAPLSC
jgi:hypothetical protein